MSNAWKGENQDAFLLSAVREGDPKGTPPVLLLGVLDGHGRNGGGASRAAAKGIAAELPARLEQAGSGGAQQALVGAFQAVAARMQADAAFDEGGAAAAVCLVEPGCVTAVWAGDCRALLGLSLRTPAGPTFYVHPLTKDHKPDRWVWLWYTGVGLCWLPRPLASPRRDGRLRASHLSPHPCLQPPRVRPHRG